MTKIRLRSEIPIYYIPSLQKWKPSVRFAPGSSSLSASVTGWLHIYPCLSLAILLICLCRIVKAVAAQRCFAALTIRRGRFITNQAQARMIRRFAPLFKSIGASRWFPFFIIPKYDALSLRSSLFADRGYCILGYLPCFLIASC